MSFITNIQTVAKYESKLLLRSWFFRVFTVLALLILGVFDFAMLAFEQNGGNWILKSIPANIPYVNLLLLNTGQAVIAIFLASDFLKRDKKLDTSEVFYVHPLSNAEYVLGKLWGNLRVFLVLNLIIMAMAMLFNAISPGTSIDWVAYPLYFFLISLPTLIFIIGLSIFLMLIFRNQALTFIILLGYIGLTVFYIGGKFYYLFDYMAYSLPLLKSAFVGITHFDTVVNHRAIYLLAGLAFICLTISLFGRLPNSRRSSYPWTTLGIVLMLGAVGCGFHHVHSILQQQTERERYTKINNQYAYTPKMVIDNYDLSIEQHAGTFSGIAEMKGVALQSAAEFAFCLNPGLEVTEVLSDGEAVKFSRDHQILLTDFGKTIEEGDTIRLTVKYSGRIDEEFCYLDIPAELLQTEYREMLMNVDKKYAFQTNDYLLCTPETYWYPRPGVAYSDENSNWQQTYFSQFNLRVKPLPGLMALSQGAQITGEDSLQYTYRTDLPIQATTLIIGKYEHKSFMRDSVQYNLYCRPGHNFLSAELDSLMDTIPALIHGMRMQMEHSTRLSYPFKRFSVVEVPAQFGSYIHTWSQAQETVQPEMVLFPEKGWKFYQMEIGRRWKDQIRWAEYSGQNIDEKEAKIRSFNDILYIFLQQEGNYNFSSAGRGNHQLTSQPNPYYLFPQFYNFRYNIFSSDWPVANRLIELYLQNRQDGNGWERDYNGISNQEKANLLLEKHTFRQMLGDAENKGLLNDFIVLKASELFAQAEINTGVSAFRDSVYSLLARNTFRNIRFEHLLDTLERIGKTDMKPQVVKWDSLTPLPFYSFAPPEVIRINNKGQETCVLKQQVSNDSDYDGIIQVQINLSNSWNRIPDPRTVRKIPVRAHETLQLVSVWNEFPYEVIIRTMVSGNLPSTVNLRVRNIVQENNRPVDQEGDFVLPYSSKTPPNEIIVDNEDPLFELSAPSVTGILPQLLDKVEDTSFKYTGVNWWRAPLQWAATTDAGYYGKYIRSAYVIRGGDGSQTATWKVPLPEPGFYEVYYWTFNKSVRNNRDHAHGEYRFQIKHNGETEEAFLTPREVGEEWEQLGVYYFDSDTVRVVLSNQSKLQTVTADAVKLVKRE